MTISRRAGAMLAAVALCAAPHAAAAAGKFDGSAPLLCVPTDIHECAADAECKRVTADSVNLPQFLRVDVKGSKVHAGEAGRESPFSRVDHLDGTLLLQGGQNGRGWTMTISETTGKMSATITATGEGFVVFGACTLLP